jgi:hypothetical protein
MNAVFYSQTCVSLKHNHNNKMWPPTEDACRQALESLEGTPVWISLWPPTGLDGGDAPWPVRATTILQSEDIYSAVLQHCAGRRVDALLSPTKEAFDMWMLDWRSKDTFFLSKQARDYISTRKAYAWQVLLELRDALDCVNDTDFVWSDIADVARFGEVPLGANPVMHHLYSILEEHGADVGQVANGEDVSNLDAVGEQELVCMISHYPSGYEYSNQHWVEATFLEYALFSGEFDVFTRREWSPDTVYNAIDTFKDTLDELETRFGGLQESGPLSLACLNDHMQDMTKVIIESNRRNVRRLEKAIAVCEEWLDKDV